MAIIRSTRQADFSLEVDGLPADEFLITRFSGYEGISTLYRFEMELASRDPQMDFDQMVGKNALLSLQSQFGERLVHGMISRFEQLGRGSTYTYYRARLVPRLWLLTLRKQSRIFQNMDVPTIVREVLTDAGIPADHYDPQIAGTYATREYCVQYRESDFDFLSRLLEEEGIHYFFRHTEDAHVLVTGDAPECHPDVPGDPVLLFNETSFGSVPDKEVGRFRFRREIRTGKSMVRDFDFKKPTLDVSATGELADPGDEGSLEDYDYPGGFVDIAAAKERAKVRLGEHRTGRDRIQGQSNCRRMIPGFCFSLEEPPPLPRNDFNGEYVVTRVNHWGNQPQALAEETGISEGEPVYTNTFDCIPSVDPLRPRRLTPRPRLEGPQTAMVTGPAGEEIYPDSFGRIKVQFHWDRVGERDEQTSCWVRVGQTWAGPGWGAMVIPRIGMEVLVSFLEGDPDRPLVTGCVYNGDNPPPYALPGEKTKSTFRTASSPGSGGFNELRFEDAAGSEEIFLHGEKDWNVVIKHDESQSIGNDENRSVGHDQSITVKNKQTIKVLEGPAELFVDGNNRVVIVDQQYYRLSKTSYEEDTEKSEQRVGNNWMTTDQGKIELKATASTITMDAGKIELKVGGSTITLTPGGIEIKGTKVTIQGTSEAKFGGGKVAVAADTECKVNGATVDVTATGAATLGGATISASASGPLSLSGTPVKAN
jgi:type VI secretion system secreted protein VgrG